MTTYEEYVDGTSSKNADNTPKDLEDMKSDEKTKSVDT